MKAQSNMMFWAIQNQDINMAEVVTPTSIVASVLRDVLDSINSTQREQEEATAVVVLEVVAPGHNDDIQMEDAPAQGEHMFEHDAKIQGDHTASVPADQFKEGVVESTSDEEEIHVDNVEPVDGKSN
ncbi:hypothetical protein Taro_007716 [Colocasia esculenta]|uniref:Uncharacterized protein n=1 Tax=Colocasia esculenta TaxID=4460 RepID=A0A843TVR8_COLES|nr:hypothetical protein [Colocasia esculenta]